MKIVIYINEKPIYLSDTIDDQLKELLHHPEVIYTDELSTNAINSVIHEIKNNHSSIGIIYNTDFEKLKKKFFDHFHLIEAAGGVVQNNHQELLFIFRKGKWDLPKGKMENKETPGTCAEREIEEETGVKQLTLKNKITETYHVYEDFRKHILKITHWFYFTCDNNQVLEPQLEEDITEIKWIETKNINSPLLNTYQTIKDVLNKFNRVSQR